MPKQPPVEYPFGDPEQWDRDLKLALRIVGLIVIMIIVLTVAGCATTQGPSTSAAITLPALPASIAGACPGPAKLPSTATGQQDVERYWATDRTNLAKCAARHAGTVTYYQGLQRQLGGAAK